MSNEAPISPTDNDVKDPNLLLRFLRKISTRVLSLGNRINNLETAKGPLSLKAIRQELQANGSVPLNIQSLPGVAAQPQLAGAPRVGPIPTGQVLQQYQDSQLILVTGTSTVSPYDLYTVVGGNPTYLVKLIGGLGSTSTSGGSFMTLDTIQTVTTGGSKTITAPWTFASTGTSTAGAINITAGQFNSSAQYSAAVASTGQTVLSSTLSTVGFGTDVYTQGGAVVHSTSSNNSRIKVPVGGAGVWIFTGRVGFLASTSTSAYSVSAYLQGNGGVILGADIRIVPTSTIESFVSCTAIRQVADGDYVELLAHQTSTGSLALDVFSGGYTGFAAHKLA